MNGGRIERSDLQFDDIVEVGRKVIVFLDTDSWERGEGLTRLRNPLKAQELIHRINQRSDDASAPRYPVTQVEPDSKTLPPTEDEDAVDSVASPLGDLPNRESLEAELLRALQRDGTADPLVRQALEGYLFGEAVRSIVGTSPRLEEASFDVLDAILRGPPSLRGPLGDSSALAELLDRIRQAMSPNQH